MKRLTAWFALVLLALGLTACSVPISEDISNWFGGEDGVIRASVNSGVAAAGRGGIASLGRGGLTMLGMTAGAGTVEYTGTVTAAGLAAHGADLARVRLTVWMAESTDANKLDPSLIKDGANLVFVGTLSVDMDSDTEFSWSEVRLTAAEGYPDQDVFDLVEAEGKELTIYSEFECLDADGALIDMFHGDMTIDGLVIRISAKVI